MSNAVRFISFVYNGGSEPGTRRYVAVYGADNSVARCFDLEKQEFRHFSKDKMSLVTEIFPVQKVDVENFGEHALERLMYTQQGSANLLTYLDGDRSTYYVLAKEPKQLRVAKLVDTNLVTITSDEGSVTFDFASGTVEAVAGNLRTAQPCPIHVYTPTGAQTLERFLDTYLGNYET